MKKAIQIILFMFIPLFINTAYSQYVHFEPFGGLTTITSPDELTNSISQNGAGFSTGYHIGLKALTEIPFLPYAPYLFFNFQRLTGEQNTLLGNINTSMNIYDLGVGLRTNLIPGPINPYLTIFAAYNNLGGLKTETPLETTISLSRSRVGAGIGAGLNISIPLLFSVNVEGVYHFVNLLGKSGDEKSVNLIEISAGISP
jgi:hypothetical protein